MIIDYNRGNRSDDGLKILEPLNIKALLSVQAVVGEGLHNFISNAEFLLDESIDRLEEFLRKGLDFRTSVVVGTEDIQSAGLGTLVILGEVDVGDLKALSDDGVDDHGLFGTSLSDADGDFIHLSLVVVLLVVLLALVVLVLLLIELGGGFDVGEQSDLVCSNSLGELDKGVVFGDGPSSIFELLLIGLEVVQILSLSLDFLIDDGVELACFLNFAEVELGSGQHEGSGRAETDGGQNSSGDNSGDHLN